MTHTQLGPVDFIVVAFPAGATNFSGELAAEVTSLVENGVVRVLDLLVVRKGDDGVVRVIDLDDLAEVVEFEGVPRRGVSIVGEANAKQFAAALRPGSTAGLIVWEHLWFAPFEAAAQRVGGQVVASGRVPPDLLSPPGDGIVDRSG